MAESSWPSPNHNSRAVTDLEFEQLTHPEAGDGLVGSTADTTFAYGDGSGMNVKIRADKYALVRGHMYSSGGSDLTKTVTANASGLTRVDLLVLRLTRSTWDVTSVVKAGTPGAGTPALTQDTGTTGVYEIPVASITVPSGDTAIGSDQVTMLGYYLGEQPIVCTSTTRPHHIAGRRIFETDTNQGYTSNGTTWLSEGAFVCTSGTRPSHQQGLLIYETDTANLMLSSSGSWIVVREDTGWISGSMGSGWTGTNNLVRLRRKNGWAMVSYVGVKTGSTLTAGSEQTMFTIPAAYRPTQNFYATADVVGSGTARVWFNASDGTVRVRNDLAIVADDIVTGSAAWPTA